MAGLNHVNKPIEELRSLRDTYAASVQSLEQKVAWQEHRLRTIEGEFRNQLIIRRKHEYSDDTHYLLGAAELEEKPISLEYIKVFEICVTDGKKKLLQSQANLILHRQLLKKVEDRLEEEQQLIHEEPEKSTHN